MTDEISSDDVEFQIPTTLPALVRKNHDRVEIRLAQTTELLRYAREVPRHPVKARLSPWWLMALKIDGRQFHHLLGYWAGTGLPIVTSVIRAADPANGFFLTANSVYESVGNPEQHEPRLEIILLVAAWLGKTSIGNLIDVIDVTY